MSESEVEQQQLVQNLSALLVEAREKLGLSQKDVAEQLFLPATFIRYIDDGLFEKLPKPAFIKGYLRSYSRVINLSGDEVVAQYEAEQECQEQTAIRGVTEEHVGSSALTGPVLQTGVIGLATTVLVGLLVWAFSGEDDEGLLPPAVMESVDPVPAIVSLPSVESLQDDLSVIEIEPDMPSEGAAEPVVEAVAPVVEAPVSVAVRSDKDVTIERTSDDAYQYITVDANGFGQLEFVLTGDCWIEIEDGEGDSIYGDLNRENDILRVYGVAPFKILLGLSSAVALRFNGDDIDLTEYTSSDQTAKLLLGDGL